MQGPARTGPKERQYLGQAQMDQVIRHSDALVDPGGSPETFQNSTECHLGVGLIVELVGGLEFGPN